MRLPIFERTGKRRQPALLYLLIGSGNSDWPSSKSPTSFKKRCCNFIIFGRKKKKDKKKLQCGDFIFWSIIVPGNSDWPSSKSQRGRVNNHSPVYRVLILPFLVVKKRTKKLQLGDFIFRSMVVPGNSDWPSSKSQHGCINDHSPFHRALILPFLVAKKERTRKSHNLAILFSGRSSCLDIQTDHLNLNVVA